MDIDWPAYQRVLDDAFHRPQDVYPVGAEEHDELLTFVPKLHKIQTARAQAASSDDGPANPEAEALGIPSSWNPRFRVNCSVVTDAKRVRRAAKESDRISREMSGLAGELPQLQLLWHAGAATCCTTTTIARPPPSPPPPPLSAAATSTITCPCRHVHRHKQAQFVHH